MLDIMQAMQGYLGENIPPDRRVLSGGDQLTCERQVGSKKHMMDGDTPRDRLDEFKIQTEDWHALMSFLGVSEPECTEEKYMSRFSKGRTTLYTTVNYKKKQLYKAEMLHHCLLMFTFYMLFGRPCSPPVHGIMAP